MNDLQETLTQMACDIRELKTSIMGNGTKGLSQRVSDLEKGQNKLNIFMVSISSVGVFLYGICQFLHTLLK